MRTKEEIEEDIKNNFKLQFGNIIKGHITELEKTLKDLKYENVYEKLEEYKNNLREMDKRVDSTLQEIREIEEQEEDET